MLLTRTVRASNPNTTNPPLIAVGADVTHPTGFDSSEPSIAAVTASYELSGENATLARWLGFGLGRLQAGSTISTTSLLTIHTKHTTPLHQHHNTNTPNPPISSVTLGRYACRVLQQAHRQEIITGLKDATRALLLNFFWKTHGKKPTAIVYYRDGVDQGQFSAVLQDEYAAIRAACAELEATYAPRITFVVVQKRHATRLFPTDRAGEDRSGNTLPGTVLDTTVCSPAGYDFFLNSHAGLQGHNKASHYQVLVDENGFTADG